MIVEGSKVLNGEIDIPGDKSISHRSIIFSSLSNGKSVIENILLSEDIYRTIEAFRQMGINIIVDKDESRVTVLGKGPFGLSKPKEAIDCGNSGTTMRLLAGLLVGQDFESKLIGDKALSSRPMTRIVEPLRKMGADIKSNNGTAPLIIKPAKLKGIEYEMPIDSAQVKSALLIAECYAEGDSEIIERNISRNHTELMMEYFEETQFNSREVFIPADISSAAFFIVSALITEGSSIMIKDVGINPTRTGILDALMDMGGQIFIKNKRKSNNELIGDIYVTHSQLKGVEISEEEIGRIIDELPILAVAAAFAEGETIVSGAGELRVKETDRITVLVNGLKKFGIDIIEKEDGFIVKGINKLKPAIVETFNDHRMAMAFSIMALRINGKSEIKDSESVEVSFPSFFQVLSLAN